MKTSLAECKEKAQWNAYAEKQDAFALLQSWDWGEFKQRMGWKVFRIAAMLGERISAAAQMLVKPLPGGVASVAYVPRGPLVDWDDEDTTVQLLDELHRIARRERAVFLKIEPPVLKSKGIQEQLARYSFRPSSKTNQPRNTIVIDIRADEGALLKSMRQKTRQNIRKVEREGIRVRIGNSQDLPAYIELMRQTGLREHFTGRSKEYYEQEYEVLNQNGEGELLLAYQGEKLLAARTVCFFGEHAAEFHAGSAEGSDHLHPNYLLVWEAIKLAKARGCVSYDLWGIPDEIEGNADQDESTYLARTDGLWGVYRFKSGFSKNVVVYAGAFDFVYSPVAYALAANSLVSTEHFERIAIWVDSLKKAGSRNGG